MLQKIREKTSGLIATVVLGLIILVMAFFGMESYMSQRVETWVARVQAPPAWWASAPSWWPVSMLWQVEEISADDFRERFEQVRQDERQRLGDAFDARVFEATENKRRILDGLIDERALEIASDRAGIVISDNMVRETIQAVEAFQVGGKFNPQQYQLVLAGQVPSRSPREFEALVREDLARTLLPAGISDSSFVTDRELERLMRLLGEKRDVSFVVLPAPAPDTGAVTAAEIQQWYVAHPELYRAPETVSIEYVDIDATQLPAPAPADEATLRQRYEQEQSRFATAEQRLASHILVEVPAGADAAAQKAAEQEAAAIAARAKAPGADFAALAREHSDDAGSKGAGGDLGWIEKNGGLGQAFEDALFAMQAGEVRGPVKSDFGWHVIQLREVRGGSRVPFEEVREQLAQQQAEADRERAFNDLTGQLVDLVYKNPTALTPAASELKLPVQTAGPFARGAGEGIAANPLVQRAAFSETLVQDGTVSDPIEIGPNHSVLIRVTGHTPAARRPLAQVRDQVVAAIRADRAAKAQAAQAEAMVASLKNGEALADLAAARGLVAPSVATALPRGAGIPAPAAGEAYFSTPAPAAGKVSPGSVKLPDGRFVVFTIDKVVPGNPDEITEQERTLLRQQLAQARGLDDARAYVQALRRRFDVEVAEERL
jgi:peptidyl-prolyl cis-trans isomerase D